MIAQVAKEQPNQDTRPDTKFILCNPIKSNKRPDLIMVKSHGIRCCQLSHDQETGYLTASAAVWTCSFCHIR